MKSSGAIAFVCMVVGLVSGTALGIDIETVPVGDPGNMADTRVMSDRTSGYGSIAYAYRVGKYEVTAGQYTDFLNAVAQSDTYGLYNTFMWSSTYGCKIQQLGSLGNYTYEVAENNANRPVNCVSFWDACRFANWLHNGQPSGAQGPGTTETGAYTLDGYNGPAGSVITRNSDWIWAVTSEDEWYKAAFYEGGSKNAGYWEYPVGSNHIDTGMATYNWSVGRTTGVGSYPYSSPYGTFDQGGNVWEWNEAVIAGVCRGLRGGSLFNVDTSLRASYRGSSGLYEGVDTGFRVALVPEPATLVLLSLGCFVALRPRMR